MQLLLVFALFLLCRDPDCKRLVEEAGPYLGDEFNQVLKSAEELSKAAEEFDFAPVLNAKFNTSPQNAPESAAEKDINFPLKPIADIADGRAMAALSGAIIGY